jgi:YggT family protein
MPQFVLGQFIDAVASILDWLLTMYFWILVLSIVVSWVNADARNPFVRFFYAATDPVLYQVRRRLPFLVAGGLDLSPLVVFGGILLVRVVVVQSLYQLAVQLRLHVA